MATVSVNQDGQADRMWRERVRAHLEIGRWGSLTMLAKELDEPERSLRPQSNPKSQIRNESKIQRLETLSWKRAVPARASGIHGLGFWKFGFGACLEFRASDFEFPRCASGAKKLQRHMVTRRIIAGRPPSDYWTDGATAAQAGQRGS